MSIKVMEPHERTPCIHCGETLCFEKGYGPEFGLCSECAETVANLYWLVHAGEPLTWPRDERPSAPVKIPPKVKWSILRRDGFRCQACGAEDRPLHVDHIVARANGGTNDESNLQALCDKCNLRKGAK